MPISEREWESIYQAIRSEMRPWEIVMGKVIDADTKSKVIYLNEFGGEPIPMVGFDYSLTTYKFVGGKQTAQPVIVEPVMPKVGDIALVARIGGSRRLPRCLGIVREDRPWTTPSNREIVGNVIPMARVYNSADQSIADGGTLAVAFNTERYDTDGIWTPAGGDNTKLVCKTAGFYIIGAHIEIQGNGTGRRVTTIRLNGTLTLATSREPSPIGSVAAACPLTTFYQLAVGDYVEVTAFQNSGVALNVVSSANFSPEFWMVRVG